MPYFEITDRKRAWVYTFLHVMRERVCVCVRERERERERDRETERQRD